MDDEQIKRQLRAFVAELSGEEIVSDLDDRTFLPDLLDSEGLTSLILMIEEEWGFALDDDQIELEIFQDVRSLASFVSLQLESDQASD